MDHFGHERGTEFADRPTSELAALPGDRNA